MIESEYLKLKNMGRIWFGKDGNSQPNVIRYLTEVEGMVPWTWWPSDEVGHTDEAKKEIHELFGKVDAFDTPKPERLVQRVLQIATNPGDWVLDSFAGSGTTGAVAHKMGRKWIMVELGEHCNTHVLPRLKQVIDCTDRGGVTEAVSWRGGGGFRYYRLAPSLLHQDKYGHWIISDEYNAAMLAEAMCKHEGFTFKPSDVHFWQHGHSTERDFIYVTTQRLNRAQLAALSEEVGPDRTLLICCSAFRVDPDAFQNLTLKKIPNTVLKRCEWGRDDYSLRIAELPQAAVEPLSEAAEPTPNAERKKAKAKSKSKAEEDFGMLFQEGDSQ